MTVYTVPHAMEVCYGSRLHCMWHNVDEPETGISRACFECWHVFQTAEELAAVWAAENGSPWPFPDQPIPSCPYCLHDW